MYNEIERPKIDPALEEAYTKSIYKKPQGFMEKYGITPGVITQLASGLVAATRGNPYLAAGLAQTGGQMQSQEFQQQQIAQQRLKDYVSDIKDKQFAYDMARRSAIEQAKLERLKMIESQKAEEAKNIGNISPEQFNREKQLRGEYIKNLGTFPDVVESYGRIQASKEDPSAAGDLALIFNYMKMLDPNSTVRESEFANAENAAGIPEKTRAQYNKILKGERLSDKTRYDFVDRANKLYDSADKIAKNMTNIYIERAKQYGLDPARTLIDFRYKKQDNIKKFSSVEQAENANLPKGTIIYINGRKAVVE